MAGKYSGGYHGTGDFEFTATTGAEIARNHAILQANAARNRARANAGSDRVVQKKDVVKKTKPKKPKKPAAGSGPGNVVVGDAPTTGPGLGIVTPNLRDETGVLVPVGGGPGNAVVGATVTAGPGAGVVNAGGLYGNGVGVPDQVTTVVIGGNVLPRDPLTSDAQVIEDAYGEAEFLSPAFFINWGAQLQNFATKPVQETFSRTGQSWGTAAGWAMDKLTENQRWAYDNDDSGPVPGSWDYQRRKARNPNWGYYDDK